jgi:DNA-binding Lrp family transcriptional regulator
MEIILSEVDERLLNALQDNGDWMNRSELSEMVGSALSPYHIARLERMIEAGLIEKKYEIRGIAQKVFYYRAK